LRKAKKDRRHDRWCSAFWLEHNEGKVVTPTAAALSIHPIIVPAVAVALG